MIIKIIAVTPPEKVKTYFTMEVNFKDEQGRTQGKKLMSFTNPSVFNTLKDAQQGESYDIETKKNDKGYWDWIGATKTTGGGDAPASKSSDAKPAAKSTYETPEERERRQRLIVRQSSLTAALSTLSVGAKSVDKEQVKALAQEYSDWVFEVFPALHKEVTFEDLEDDIPY